MIGLMSDCDKTFHWKVKLKLWFLICRKDDGVLTGKYSEKLDSGEQLLLVGSESKKVLNRKIKCAQFYLDLSPSDLGHCCCRWLTSVLTSCLDVALYTRVSIFLCTVEAKPGWGFFKFNAVWGDVWWFEFTLDQSCCVDINLRRWAFVEMGYRWFGIANLWCLWAPFAEICFGKAGLCPWSPIFVMME